MFTVKAKRKRKTKGKVYRKHKRKNNRTLRFSRISVGSYFVVQVVHFYRNRFLNGNTRKPQCSVIFSFMFTINFSFRFAFSFCFYRKLLLNPPLTLSFTLPPHMLIKFIFDDAVLGFYTYYVHSDAYYTHSSLSPGQRV
jgi:hypothetical protein